MFRFAVVDAPPYPSQQVARSCCIRTSVLIAVVAHLIAGYSSASPISQSPPNVILLMVDTLRADYVGAYGFDGPISPNLDSFAAESIKFERCISVAP